MAERYDVHIAGYTLTVSTDRSADHMERLGRLLNERVREVQKTGGSANYLHVVLLAALKLGDEVIDLRARLEQERKRVEEKGRGLLDALDGALK